MERFFKLKENKTTVSTEIIAGITTFFAMAYILFVNSSMLADPYLIEGSAHFDPVKAEMIRSGVFIATCLSAFLGTFLMAVLAKLPFAQAPGMGLNAFFAYTICLVMGYTYEQALALVLISGLLFIIITAVGAREAIVKAIPANIKVAISAGIGLFIALIGLKNAGLVVEDSATLVTLIDFSQITNPEMNPMIIGALMSLVGLIVIGVLYKLKVKGSILIGIIVTTVLCLITGVTQFTMPEKLMPDFGAWVSTSLFKMDFAGLFAGKDSVFSMIVTIVGLVITFSLVDMFDTIGTLIGTAKRAGMLKEDGTMPNMKKAMMCDAIATTAGACLGTSTVTTYVESSAGISEGGKTGLTSLTTSILFLLALFLAPFTAIVPGQATAPALIFVGVLMTAGIKDVEMDDMTEAIPAFLTLAMMPFTYSIANGIAFGLISYVLLKTFTGKIKDVHPLTWVISLFFILRYVFMIFM